MNIDQWLNQHALTKDEAPSDEAIAAAKHFGVEDFVLEWRGEAAIISGVRVEFRSEHPEYPSGIPAVLVWRSNPEVYENWVTDVSYFSQILGDEIKYLNRPRVMEYAVLLGDGELAESMKKLSVLMNTGGWTIASKQIVDTDGVLCAYYTLTRN